MLRYTGWDPKEAVRQIYLENLYNGGREGQQNIHQLIRHVRVIYLIISDVTGGCTFCKCLESNGILNKECLHTSIRC